MGGGLGYNEEQIRPGIHEHALTRLAAAVAPSSVWTRSAVEGRRTISANRLPGFSGGSGADCPTGRRRVRAGGKKLLHAGQLQEGHRSIPEGFRDGSPELRICAL